MVLWKTIVIGQKEARFTALNSESNCDECMDSVRREASRTFRTRERKCVEI